MRLFGEVAQGPVMINRYSQQTARGMVLRDVRLDFSTLLEAEYAASIASSFESYHRHHRAVIVPRPIFDPGDVAAEGASQKRALEVIDAATAQSISQHIKENPINVHGEPSTNRKDFLSKRNSGFLKSILEWGDIIYPDLQENPEQWPETTQFEQMALAMASPLVQNLAWLEQRALRLGYDIIGMKYKATKYLPESVAAEVKVKETSNDHLAKEVNSRVSIIGVSLDKPSPILA